MAFSPNPTLTELRARLDRANARCDQARTDAEFIACRELAMAARYELENMQHKLGRAA